MTVGDVLRRASVANVTAGVILIGTVVYCVFSGDVEILKYLSAFAAGYLFKRGVESGEKEA